MIKGLKAGMMTGAMACMCWAICYIEVNPAGGTILAAFCCGLFGLLAAA